MTIAAWHQKRLGRQLARDECAKHTVGPATGLRDYIDARQGNRFVQISRDCATDHHVDPQVGQLLGPRGTTETVEPYFVPPDCPVVLNIDYERLSCDVEDRRYSIVPCWQGNTHRLTESNSHTRSTSLGQLPHKPFCTCRLDDDT